MIRLKISAFIKKYKTKIQELGVKLIMVAIAVFMVTMIIKSFQDIGDNQEMEDPSNLYRPTDTIISGSNISKEQYENDKNLVNDFLSFCNKGEVENAYALLSDECKAESYDTIEKFKTLYYNPIFTQERECNLQSWISTKEYTVYKVRYTNAMLSTGVYDPNNVYQDYLTLRKKDNTEKISIGYFIDSEACDVTTQTDILTARVTKRNIYLKYEEYEIEITNRSQATILLSKLDDTNVIMLKGKDNSYHKVNLDPLFSKDLILEPNLKKKITLKFTKDLVANVQPEEIEFRDVVTHYYEYKKSPKNYKDIIQISIKVED